MITAQEEKLEDILDEVKSIVHGHYDELSVHKRHGFALDPQYDEYIERERNGKFLFLTLRVKGALVGYFGAFVGQGMHYATCNTMSMDLFWLNPDFRGRMGGVTLFREVVRVAKARGIDLVIVGRKLDSPENPEPLFRYFGFEPAEQSHWLWLKEGK